MNRRDRALVLATVANNKLNVALHTVAGIALIGSSVGFSAMIALYFGFDVLGMKDRSGLSALAENKVYAISAAIVFALISLVARAGQTLIEAKVTVERERWFAEELRASPAAKLVQGNIARASNYYGRLSNVSMRTVSIVCVLVVSLIGLIIHLPPHYGTIGVGVVLTCFVGLYGIMKTLTGRITDATHGLFQHAKEAGAWKLNSKNAHTEEVDLYYKSYQNRLILSSSFSFAPLFFALVFSIFILLMHESKAIDVDFGEVFIVFALLRAYLALVSSFFTGLLQSAAFLPAVKPYAAFIQGLSLPQESQSVTDAKYLAEEPVLEEDSMGEI
ncbi:hypothetical protein [Microvirga sp. G4-2]|uniref:hypothetical protein n=1 Tax=Microvirga sp. G4-2 TaxID=3434467 RepID=UPI004044E6B6